MPPPLKFALPVVPGRGAGLGNELFPWAKAYIGARALGLRLLHPAWGMNARQYWRHFGTSRLDWVAHRIATRVLPRFAFTEEEYKKRMPASFYDALVTFGRENCIAERATCVVEFSGMWGGVPAVIEARDFVLKSLLNTRYAVDNLFGFRRRLDPKKFSVGVHIRRGDFHGTLRLEDYAAKINVGIPIDWFVNICRVLKAAHGERIEVVIFGDATTDELAPLMGVLRDSAIRMQDNNSDISDMLAMASCDLIVCSLSSYSVWAATLGGGRYIWLEPHLTEVGGRLTIWGYEKPPQLSHILTRQNVAKADQIDPSAFVGRGVGVGWEGAVPEELHAYIEREIALRCPELDLMLYGAITRPATNRPNRG